MSIFETKSNSLEVRFTKQEVVVDVDRILSILNIHMSRGPTFVADFLTIEERNTATAHLCGKVMIWSEKNCIPGSLHPVYHIFCISIS